jgi:hypothetical protein
LKNFFWRTSLKMLLYLSHSSMGMCSHSYSPAYRVRPFFERVKNSPSWFIIDFETLSRLPATSIYFSSPGYSSGFLTLYLISGIKSYGSLFVKLFRYRKYPGL